MADAGCNHLHTDYEQELVLLFFKVLRFLCSGSKLVENTVQCGKVIAGKLCAQFDKQRSLSGRQFPAVKIKSIRNLDAAAIPSAYRFDGVGTHKHGNILTDGFSGNLKFKCQIAVCIVPPYAQHF
jgi:hypothetical protein